MWTLGPGTSTSGVLNYTSDSLIDNLTSTDTNTTFTAANTTAAAALEMESEAVNVTQVVPQIDPSVPQPVFTITEKAPTRAFSWLKAPTSKTLC